MTAQATAQDVKSSGKPSKSGERGERSERINALSVDANQLIERLAEELRNMPQIKPPAWAAFVKTGVHKERPPQTQNWWYVRAAAVLRTLARLGPVGTSKLRAKFGGKHSRGHKPEHYAKGSGSIIRKALQQLEKAGLVKYTVKGLHKGRVITEKASLMMDAIALQIVKESREEEAKEAKPVKAVKASAAASAAKTVEEATAKLATPAPATTPAPAAGEAVASVTSTA